MLHILMTKKNYIYSAIAIVVLAGGLYYFTRKKSDVALMSAKSAGVDSFGLPNNRASAIVSILAFAKKGNATIKDEETLKELSSLTDAEVVAYNKMLNSMFNDALVQELKEVKTDSAKTLSVLNKFGISDADMKLGAQALSKMTMAAAKNAK